MDLESTNDEWAIYSKLVVKLKPQVDVSAQRYRDENWFVLRDAGQRQHARLDQNAFQVVKTLDGYRTLEGVYSSLKKREFDIEPEDIVAIVRQLFSSDLLINAGSLVDQQAAFKKLRATFLQEQKNKAFNPLSIKVPLIDPDRFLSKALPYLNPFLGKKFAVLAALIILFGFAQLIVNFGKVSGGFNSDLIRVDNAAIMVGVYLIMKLLHEFAHAIVLKRWGGEVREMGITLLVLMPIPYVDASDAWFVSSKKRRMWISFVGIFSELLMASLALLLWLSVSPGVVSQIAFNTVVIGGLSTILFNANPLLKFDGYYILQDWLEIPNFATRSNKCFRELIKRRFLGVNVPADSLQNDKMQRVWMLLYAPLALIYRLVILATITMYLASQYLFLGVVLACWAISMQLLLPLVNGLKYLFSSPELEAHRSLALGRCAVVLLLLTVTSAFVPVPLNSSAQGVLWVSGKSEVIQQIDGFLDEIYVKPGAAVEQGDILMRFRNIELETSYAVKRAQLTELEARLRSHNLTARLSYKKAKRDIQSLSYELDHLKNKIDQLTIKSQAQGRFYLNDLDVSTGQYFARGELVGYLRSDDNLVIKAVIPHHMVALFENETRDISFRLAENPDQIYKASVSQQGAQGSNQLPSAALGAMGGGDIAVYSEKGGVHASNDHFQVELTTSEHLSDLYGLGGRAYIKIAHGSEPLLQQWWRNGVQLFVGRLES